jgi:hypothetical protein
MQREEEMPKIQNDLSLVTDCLSILKKLGLFRVEFHRGRGKLQLPYDGQLSLRFEEFHFDYRVVTKKFLNRAGAFLEIQDRLEKPESHRTVIFTDHVTPPIAEQLRKRRIEFVDASGNIFLHNPPLYIHVIGEKRKERIVKPTAAFKSNGLKVIFTIIKTPEAVNWRYRRLSEASGISLGSIGPIFHDLRRKGFIRLSGKRSRNIAHPDGLLNRWDMQYPEELRPRLFLNRYRLAGAKPIPEILHTAEEQALLGKILIGGELAASIITGQIRPEKATLHLVGDPAEITTQLRLIQDSNGPITLLKTFGDMNSWEDRNYPYIFADPLLIRAELLLDNSERLDTIAQKLYDTIIYERLMHS